MKKIYSFKEQIVISDAIEVKVIEYFKNMSNCIALTDLRKIKKYQDLDIDFHVVLLNTNSDCAESRMCEVKVDFRIAETGNFFIEPDGWLRKSKAEIILYLDYIKGYLYYLDNDKLKKYVYEHSTDWQSRMVSTGDFGGYSVEGWLVPYTKVVQALDPFTEDINYILHDVQEVSTVHYQAVKE